MGDFVTVKERKGGIYTQDVIARSHRLYADEPESYGSADLGPAPFEYVCAGLGACTTMTLRMYAERKKWPVSHLAVDVSYKKSGTGDEMKHVFVRDITIEGDLDEAQRARMLEIANKCPVHRMLEGQIEIRTGLFEV